MKARSGILVRTVAAPVRELAFRESLGIKVALVWDPAEDRVLLRVRDRRTARSFVIALAGSRRARGLPPPVRLRSPRTNRPEYLAFTSSCDQRARVTELASRIAR